MIQCFTHSVSLPIGDFILTEVDGFLCALSSDPELQDLKKQLGRYLSRELQFTEKPTDTLMLAQTQLQEYFSGSRREFQLPTKLYGSDFQQAVWQQLQQIPYGSTTTYGTIAIALTQKGARAVGTAVGRNPLPIIVPCHRVLPQSGDLGNFSMQGGAAVKAILLDLEGAHYNK